MGRGRQGEGVLSVGRGSARGKLWSGTEGWTLSDSNSWKTVTPWTDIAYPTFLMKSGEWENIMFNNNRQISTINNFQFSIPILKYVKIRQTLKMPISGYLNCFVYIEKMRQTVQIILSLCKTSLKRTVVRNNLLLDK